jgi:hypothetical protein
MQASSDNFLGWHRILSLDGVQRDYYARQLKTGRAPSRSRARHARA